MQIKKEVPRNYETILPRVECTHIHARTSPVRKSALNGDGLGEHEAHGVHRAGRELQRDALPAQAVEALGPAADEPADGEERDGGHRPSRRPGVRPNVILERCKGVQNFVSIQPRMSPVKFAASL